MDETKTLAAGDGNSTGRKTPQRTLPVAATQPTAPPVAIELVDDGVGVHVPIDERERMSKELGLFLMPPSAMDEVRALGLKAAGLGVIELADGWTMGTQQAIWLMIKKLTDLTMQEGVSLKEIRESAAPMAKLAKAMIDSNKILKLSVAPTAPSGHGKPQRIPFPPGVPVKVTQHVHHHYADKKEEPAKES